LQAPSIISTEKCVDPLDSMDIGRKGGWAHRMQLESKAFITSNMEAMESKNIGEGGRD
jgi:hypothetical protein